MTLANTRQIFLRADGNSRIGLGHIFRCLALAEILKGEGKIIFLTRSIPEQLQTEIKAYCDELVVLDERFYNEEAELIAKSLKQKYLIICDGYEFDTTYQLTLKNSGAKLVCIDDIISHHFVADVVINHAGGVLPDDYSCESYTRLCLGPSYSIVRSPFWNKPATQDRNTEKVFVCLGGADPKNDLINVLEIALRKAPGKEYNVVTGSAYRYQRQLAALIATNSAAKHFANLRANDMSILMQQCGVAILSPSTVSYEYLSLGGEVYLHTIADNQANIYRHFVGSGLAFAFDRFGAVSETEKTALLSNQSKIFDGKSHYRIKEAIIGG